jgi:hypothetical protein
MESGRGAAAGGISRWLGSSQSISQQVQRHLPGQFGCVYHHAAAPFCFSTAMLANYVKITVALELNYTHNNTSFGKLFAKRSLFL